MHMNGHLKEMLLDFGPVYEFWLFSYERYNGILKSQPTNNRHVKPQLMSRFLQDNSASNFNYPEEYADDFSLTLSDRIVGSLLDTLTLGEFQIPTKSSRGVLDSDEIQVIEMLYRKLYPTSATSEINVTSIFLKFSHVIFKGKKFGSQV